MGILKKYSKGSLMLRGAPHKAEITQKELAQILGISQHHIREIEKDPLEKKWQGDSLYFLKPTIGSFCKIHQFTT